MKNATPKKASGSNQRGLAVSNPTWEISVEPASAASLAGARKLRDMGVIAKDDRVVCVLTGNLLKDPETTVNYHIKGVSARYSNKPVVVEADLDRIEAVLSQGNKPAPGQEVKHLGD